MTGADPWPSTIDRVMTKVDLLNSGIEQMNDPVLIRITVPLAIVAFSFWAIDGTRVILQLRKESRGSKRPQPSRKRLYLTMAGVFLLILMALSLSVTIHYRTDQLRRLREQRAPQAAVEALKRQAWLEGGICGATCLAYFVTGIASMRLMRVREDRKFLTSRFDHRGIEPQ